MTSLTANWSYPTNVRFGAGRIEELADACAEAGIKRPLLVTDRGLADAAITQTALDVLKRAGLLSGLKGTQGAGLFADVDPNPSDRNLEAGVQAFRDGNHDGVVAFGGGSGLDWARWWPSWQGSAARSGISKTSTTGGPAQTPTRFFPRWPFRRPREPVRRSAAPAC